MGPASGGLQVFTLRRKARKGVGYSGTPWSGHAVNWNWRTSRFSLEPFWKEQRGAGWLWWWGWLSNWFYLCNKNRTKINRNWVRCFCNKAGADMVHCSRHFRGYCMNVLLHFIGRTTSTATFKRGECFKRSFAWRGNFPLQKTFTYVKLVDS